VKVWGYGQKEEKDKRWKERGQEEFAGT